MCNLSPSAGIVPKNLCIRRILSSVPDQLTVKSLCFDLIINLFYISDKIVVLVVYKFTDSAKVCTLVTGDIIL